MNILTTFQFSFGNCFRSDEINGCKTRPSAGGGIDLRVVASLLLPEKIVTAGCTPHEQWLRQQDKTMQGGIDVRRDTADSPHTGVHRSEVVVQGDVVRTSHKASCNEDDHVVTQAIDAAADIVLVKIIYTDSKSSEPLRLLLFSREQSCTTEHEKQPKSDAQLTRGQDEMIRLVDPAASEGAGDFTHGTEQRRIKDQTYEDLAATITSLRAELAAKDADYEALRGQLAVISQEPTAQAAVLGAAKTDGTQPTVEDQDAALRVSKLETTVMHLIQANRAQGKVLALRAAEITECQALLDALDEHVAWGRWNQAAAYKDLQALLQVQFEDLLLECTECGLGATQPVAEQASPVGQQVAAARNHLVQQLFGYVLQLLDHNVELQEVFADMHTVLHAQDTQPRRLHKQVSSPSVLCQNAAAAAARVKQQCGRLCDVLGAEREARQLAEQERSALERDVTVVGLMLKDALPQLGRRHAAQVTEYKDMYAAAQKRLEDVEAELAVKTAGLQAAQQQVAALQARLQATELTALVRAARIAEMRVALANLGTTVVDLAKERRRLREMRSVSTPFEAQDTFGSNIANVSGGDRSVSLHDSLFAVSDNGNSVSIGNSTSSATTSSTSQGNGGLRNAAGSSLTGSDGSSAISAAVTVGGSLATAHADTPVGAAHQVAGMHGSNMRAATASVKDRPQHVEAQDPGQMHSIPAASGPMLMRGLRGPSDIVRKQPQGAAAAQEQQPMSTRALGTDTDISRDQRSPARSYFKIDLDTSISSLSVEPGSGSERVDGAGAGVCIRSGPRSMPGGAVVTKPGTLAGCRGARQGVVDVMNSVAAFKLGRGSSGGELYGVRMHGTQAPAGIIARRPDPSHGSSTARATSATGTFGMAHGAHGRVR